MEIKGYAKGFVMRQIIVIVCLCFLCVMSACKKAKEVKEDVPEEKFREESYEVAPISYYNEICVIEDCLYYCDPDRNATLYAYNMKTKEEVCITEQSGKLQKTQRGYFYLSGNLVYQLDGLEVKLFCELPEDGEFLGFFQNKIIWCKSERYVEKRLDGGGRERFSRQSILWQEMEDAQSKIEISVEASEQLYSILPEQGCLGMIGVSTEGVYFAQDKESAPMCGLYYLSCNTKEVRLVIESDIMGIYDYNEVVLVKGYDSIGYECLFLVDTMTQNIQKLKDSEGAFGVLMQDGKIYYDGAEAIRCYIVEDNSCEVLSEGEIYSHQPYSEMAMYEDYLILRHCYGYYFVVLDLETGEIKQVSD